MYKSEKVEVKAVAIWNEDRGAWEVSIESSERFYDDEKKQRYNHSGAYKASIYDKENVPTAIAEMCEIAGLLMDEVDLQNTKTQVIEVNKNITML